LTFFIVIIIIKEYDYEIGDRDEKNINLLGLRIGSDIVFRLYLMAGVVGAA